VAPEARHDRASHAIRESTQDIFFEREFSIVDAGDELCQLGKSDELLSHEPEPRQRGYDQDGSGKSDHRQRHEIVE
jgi:hypothetical protein